MTTPDHTLAARLAEAFHSAYERLAPSFGYETREDTKTFSPDSQNGKLMIATCADILSSNQLITTAEADARVEAAVQKALREHAGREETGESITEKYLRRYPQSKKTKAWEGAMVYLRTQNGIWRPDGHGYTVNFSEAWAMPLSDARKIVSGIYEDHGGTYFRATAAAIRSRGVAG